MNYLSELFLEECKSDYTKESVLKALLKCAEEMSKRPISLEEGRDLWDAVGEFQKDF